MDKKEEGIDFEEWYQWFTNMLSRKADEAEKNAILHLVANATSILKAQEQTRVERLIKKFEGMISPVFDMNGGQWEAISSPDWQALKEEEGIRK